MTAKVVGIPREIVSRYPIEWRDCCLELIKEYRSIREMEFGTEYKWTRICNEIIRFLAEYYCQPVSQFKGSLRRQDFEHWEKGSVGPKDPKFMHIDLFVRSKLANPNSSFLNAKTKVIEYKQSKQLDALKYLFNGGSFEENMEATFDNFRSKFFILDTYEQERNIAIYFSEKSKIKYTITLLAYKNNLTEVDEIFDKASIYFGYLLPLSTMKWPPLNHVVEAIAAVFDRTYYKSDGRLFHKFSNIFLNTDQQRLGLFPYRDRTNTFWQPDSVSNIDNFRTQDGKQFDFLSYDGDQTIVFKPIKLNDTQTEFLENLQDEYLLW